MSFLNWIWWQASPSIFSRYAMLGTCIIITCISLIAMPYLSWAWIPVCVAGLLSLIGAHDLLQSHHAVLRNYPILGHIRYLVETIRPEIRQYLLEADNDALPFSRSQRSLIYARAKGEHSDKPFGTLIDVYENGYEFIGHSSRPMPESNPDEFRLTIGNEQCANPIHHRSSISRP